MRTEDIGYYHVPSGLRRRAVSKFETKLSSLLSPNGLK
jgi:hypothetical protein